jgi:hypothetical protein
MRSWLAAAVLGALLIAAPGPAAGNGRFPASRSISVRPGADADLYLGLTFGLLISRDDGWHWHWLCEESIGYGGTFDPKYAIAPDGTIYATTYEGLRVSRDGGCTFTTATAPPEGPGDLVGLWVDAIDIAPDGTVWFGTAESGLPNAVYRSTDQGRTAQKMGLDTKTAWWKSLRIAPSDPRRIYVTGYQVAPTIEVFVHRSDDGGTSWRPMPVGELALGNNPLVLIEAVDPDDPDLVYLRSVGAVETVGDRLYRSADGGAQWQPVLDVPGGIDALVVRAGGAVLAGAVPGEREAPGCLYRSTDRGRTFGPCEAAPQVACLAERGDGTLFSCGRNWEPDYATLARSRDGRAWSKVLRFHEMAGPLACPAGTVQHDTCEAQIWPGLREQFMVSGPVDGGGGDGDGDGGDGPGDGGPGTGGGCCDASQGAAAGAVGLAILVGSALLWRRRRRRRACCS